MVVENRQSSCNVRITDKAGNPIAGKKVKFTQTNNEFLFGCGGFDALPLFDNPENELFKERMDAWGEIFNYATIPFYWGGYEPVEGDIKKDSRMFAAKFLIDKGAKVKGHPLCWHTVCADWLLKYDNKTIMDKQLERIHRDVTAFKGVVDIWDVINETVIMPEFDRYDNAITRICNAYGRDTLIKEVFEAAHAANPDALLLINDFNLSDSYKEVIERALDSGAPIGAIGLQTHQHQGFRGIEWMQSVIDRFSPLGLPLHFTENTLVSGEIMPGHIVDLNDWVVDEWPSTPEGEARQADEYRQMYECAFNNPCVEAFTGWDFADGAWLNAPSGIIRKDNSKKPSFEVLKNLVRNEWNTEVELQTDENGMVTLKGYRGSYKVELSDDNKRIDEIVLSKEQKECLVSL